MDTTEVILTERRRRLEPVGQDIKVKPFLRAQELEDISLYWAPVDTFPMSFRVRAWWMAFLTRFRQLMAERTLRQENFLQFKTVTAERSGHFMSTAMDFIPVTGIGLKPGSSLPPLPEADQLKKESLQPDFSMHKHLPDYTYWFVRKQDEEQRQHFFGMGGMAFLWLKKDPATQPPDLKLPPAARRLMESHGSDIQKQLDTTYALLDSFLKKSKAVFGKTIQDDPVLKNAAFVLPLLSSRDFFAAAPETRQQWFDVFDGYCTESPEDRGILIAVKDPAFDAPLSALLEQMRSEGMEYPL
jgi:hypothetical protein